MTTETIVRNQITLLPHEITDRVTLKSVKRNFGHDLCGFYADICVDGKKVGYHNDDGWGGEVDYQFTNEKALQDILTNADFKEYTLRSYQDTGLFTDWKIENIRWDMMYSELVEKLDFLRQFATKQKKALIWGNPKERNYCIRSWNTPLEAIAQTSKMALKVKFEETLAELKPGEVFYNTNLLKLGLCK